MTKLAAADPVRTRRALIVFWGLVSAALTAALYALIYDASRWGIALEYSVFVAGASWRVHAFLRDWKKVGWLLFSSALASCLALWPGRGETDYSFASHAALVPVYFILAFMLITLFLCWKQLAVPLGAGETLVHSVVAAYWLAAAAGPRWALWLCGLPTLLVAAEVFRGGGELGHGERLALSLWSTLLMLVFSVAFAVGVVLMGPAAESWTQGHAVKAAYVLVQYFLMGAAGPYIFFNLVVLAGYVWPAPGGWFSAKWRAKVEALDRQETARYAARRPSRAVAAAVALAAVAALALNYRAGAVAPGLAVWAALLLAAPAAQLLEARLVQAHG